MIGMLVGLGNFKFFMIFVYELLFWGDVNLLFKEEVGKVVGEEFMG